jgi:hypothetical protein
VAVLYRGADAVLGPLSYRVPRSAAAPVLLDDAGDAWASAPVISWGPDRWRTWFRAAATLEGLAVRFDCRDDEPWHTHTRRDDMLWQEEVAEIFLDPACSGRSYAEIEISPVNVVCDLRILEPWPALRGDLAWDFEGLVTRVTRWQDPDAGPDGWTALAWLPWAGFTSLSPESAAAVPPRPRDRWRFNVFRIKRPGGPQAPEHEAVYAAWSVPEGPSFHAPAAFRELIFT